MDIRVRLAGRVMIAAAFVLTLAACSGEPMSSFDGEKNRIRSALPADVKCTEQGAAGQGRSLSCGNGALDVTVLGDDPPARLDVGIRYQEGFGVTSPDALRAVAKAYGIDDADLDQCAAGHEEQYKTYRVTCSGSISGTLMIEVTQQRPV